MDQIRESLNRIAELSEEEIKSLEDSVLSEYGSVKDQDPSPEVVETLKELATTAKALKEEKTRRVTEAAELAAQASDAVTEIEALTAKEDDAAEESVEEVLEESGVEEEAVPTEEEPETLEPEKVEEEATPEEEDEDKDKGAFATENPVEAEASVVEAAPEAVVESELAVATPEETELASKQEAEVEEEIEPKEEFSVEAPSDTATNEPTNIEVAEFATELKESAEGTMTASNIPNPEASESLAVEAVSPVTITAGADLPGIVAGTELPNMRAVAQAMLDRKKGMGRTTGGDGEQALVASFKTSFPDDRYLTPNDIEGNKFKVSNLVSAEAITAAGGLTAPVETSYDIYGLGETAGRPVRDSLAVFGAERGGIRFMTPPVLSDLDGASSVWTLADDIAAAEDGATITKPCLRVKSGVEVTVYTDAIPLCLTFGNLGARAYPELVERHTELAMVAHARFAETRLLTRIGTLSTSVSAAAQLGAARDIMVQVDTAAAGFRSRYRLDPKAPMRAMFPEWFKNALRSDLVKQLPGDGQEAAFDLAESKINSWFKERNINVTWFLDGETGQIFGAQEEGALDSFPENVIWYLFPDGTFLFLDGGVLDLGLVRDSTLNGTNDYKVFVENFEGVAKVGVESLRITSTVKIAGASAGTVNTLA